MGLTILLAIISAAIAIPFTILYLLYFRNDGVNWTGLPSAVFSVACGAFLLTLTFGGLFEIRPAYAHAKYYNNDIASSVIYFNGYSDKPTMDGKMLLTIPSHYYKKLGFINTYELCTDELIILHYPNQEVAAERESPILPSPSIIKGKIDCTEK